MANDKEVTKWVGSLTYSPGQALPAGWTPSSLGLWLPLCGGGGIRDSSTQGPEKGKGLGGQPMARGPMDLGGL